MVKNERTRILSILVLALSAALPAYADATSSTPKEFKTGTYVESDYEDFCSSQSSGRKCIEVTIKNSSMSKIDTLSGAKSGSVLGSGALDGFQVFEIPGCIDASHLPSNVRKEIPSGATFTRRTREEKLHYWKPGRHKTIKVLQGCSYAVAVKRMQGHHHWHLSYIPSSAKTGCTLNYKYITKKADLDEFERWALFGATGGELGALGGSVAAGGIVFARDYMAIMADGEDVASVAIADAANVALPAALEAGVYLVAAVAAYEAGLWSVFGVESLINIVDGTRDFTLNREC